MEKPTIHKEELKAIGIPNGQLLLKFQRVCNSVLKQGRIGKPELLSELKRMVVDPLPFAKTKNQLRTLAHLLIEKVDVRSEDNEAIQYDIRATALGYPIYGKEHIDSKALAQMDVAMRLPISVAGALMPDAHAGYGLPIGGVLATDVNTIIPYAVGVDIACRMCMSIFDVPATVLDKELARLKWILNECTFFGMGSTSKEHFDTHLFDSDDWKATKLIRSLKDKAYSQLGTSGTGNHFVEWGTLSIGEGSLADLPAGEYLTLLSHSGSRGFGSTLANYYSTLAIKKTGLPREARELAWLDLNSEEGQEYWISMNLAGNYASANHHEIHNKIADKFGIRPVRVIENHHNFAWKEKLTDGSDVMVHRKGATPAGKGVLGIIPGSMATPGFLVAGKGELASINSASHGAGRLMSRNQAFKEFKSAAVAELLRSRGITLLGSGLDEAPMAYKDIHAVMKAQESLVEVLGTFMPKIVKMADPRERPED
ncbi:MAG: tRNA-splicing ligase RtcB [Pedobacter sp.]|nr:tRNA-splicing ligase RtcB [Pedobacter sp.]